MRIELEPTLYSDIIESMRTSEPFGAPTGTFYLLNNIIVPFRPFPTTFRVEVDHNILCDCCPLIVTLYL